MGDQSAIEWTDATWNPTVGCSIVSPGCTNCYAMKMAARIEAMGGKAGAKYAGLTRPSKAGAVWSGAVRLDPDALLQPLRWMRGRRIFVNSMSDLFHEDLPDAAIDKVFAVMALAPQHTLQVLTKRSARMRAYMNDPATQRRIARQVVDLWIAGKVDAAAMTTAGTWPVISIGDPEHPDDLTLRWPLPNVWLGVSAEDQARADERIPDLLATPAAVRFVSAEPLLGPLDARPWLSDASGCERCDDGDGLAPPRCSRRDIPRAEQCPERLAVFRNTVAAERVILDWIIVGGETGPGARPMHPDWARAIRDQCAVARVPFFFKQWGEFREFDCGTAIGVHEEIDDDSDGANDAVRLADRPSWITFDGRHIERRADLPFDVKCRLIERVGKGRAGRLLDGVTHDAFPARNSKHV